MFKAFPQVRTSSLKKVTQVNDMPELVGIGFREAAFEALAGEILDAFASYPTLRAVTFKFGTPTIAFQLGSEDPITDFVLSVQHSPSLITNGAYITEWEDDFSGFIEKHFPLAKMGLGSYTLSRENQATKDFFAAVEEGNYALYRKAVSQLMLDINMSFGGQYVQQSVA